MDPLERADAMLARARSRGAFVVTPESAVSPMDAASTLQLPRMVVTANDERQDGDATLVAPDASGGAGQETVPAIAQEALTDMVESPGIRSRQRRIEEARARGVAARKQAAEAEAAQSAQTSEIAQPAQEGIVPTATQRPEEPGSLSQRLDG
jgi:hypothetical protein